MTPLLDAAGWALLHFVWQASVIAAVAAIGFYVLQGATSNVRYTVASAALLLMLLSPVVTTALLLAPSPTTTASASSPMAAFFPQARHEPQNAGPGAPSVRAANARQRIAQILPAVVIVWLTGVAVLLVRLIGGWWRVRGLQRAALSALPSTWQLAGDRLSRRLGLRRRVHVMDSDTVVSPAVIGWWRPVIMLPLAALSGLTPGQMDAILTHELAHIRRHDYLVNVLQHVAETLLFYHPAVWWVSRHMRIEREQCCDTVVVDLCGDAWGYAAALTHLEEARCANAAFALAATDGSMVERIHRVLIPRSYPQRPIAHALVTASTMTVLVLVVAGGYRWSIRPLQASGRPAPQEDAAVIATVNGEPVTQTELDHFRPLHGEAVTTPLARVLVELTDERLVAQRGQQLGLKVTDGEIQDAVVYLKRLWHVQTDAQLQAQLATQHLTMSELRRHLERAIIGFHVRDGEVFDRIVVTDEEARRYFDAHLDEFPLQTFELARVDLILRLRQGQLRTALTAEWYLRPLREAATIVWMAPEFQRAYEEDLRQRAAPQGRSDLPPGQLGSAAAAVTERAQATETRDIAITVNGEGLASPEFRYLIHAPLPTHAPGPSRSPRLLSLAQSTRFLRHSTGGS